MKWVCKTQVLSIWGHRVFNLVNLTDSYKHVFCVRHYFRSTPHTKSSVLIITLWGRSRYYPPIRAKETEAQRSCDLWPRFPNGEVLEWVPAPEPLLTILTPRGLVCTHMTTGKNIRGLCLWIFLFFPPIPHFKNHLKVVWPLFLACFSQPVLGAYIKGNIHSSLNIWWATGSPSHRHKRFTLSWVTVVCSGVSPFHWFTRSLRTRISAGISPCVPTGPG